MGIYALSIATSNFWIIKTTWFERIAFAAAAILMINPGLYTDLLGMALILLTGAFHLFRSKKQLVNVGQVSGEN
ncbi:hypothetical protein PAK37_19150 [Proteus mirabilis]|uniref:hypothetical protein n=1 Tax=Proteus mirabilis TaxID=584 RepID=UPI002577ADC6|nr:hypothetical protein [Proteus mirabilis]MDM3554912.1 hypothetical protein [Proteus mirabilis]